MPIASETEVLTLIERWNAAADKPKDHIVQLMCCFRPDSTTIETFRTWLRNMGWLTTSGEVPDNPELHILRKLMQGGNGKLPRHNVADPVGGGRPHGSSASGEDEEEEGDSASDVIF